MFQKILVGLDGSSVSEQVLSALAPLLASPATSVLVARAIPGGPIADDLAAQGPVLEYLRRIRAELVARGVRASGHMLVGDDPAAQLAAFAAEKGVSAIAVATHGRSGVARLVLGSIAERLVRIAPCPVILVNPSVAGAAVRLDRVLVPLDAPERVADALAVASEVAREDGAELVLLHVAERETAAPELAVGDGRTLAEQTFERARDVLSEKLPGARSRTIVGEGSPARAILDAIGETGAGAVVMSTHGRAGLARVALGSVAEEVIRRAPVPVIATCPR